MEKKSHFHCPHHIVVPIFVVCIGILFLLDNRGVISHDMAGTIWPILLILIGLQKIFEKRCSCYKACKEGQPGEPHSHGCCSP